MSGSIGEIRAILTGVAERLASAREYSGIARGHLTEAAGVLTELGELHGQPLAPPELLAAVEELDRGLGLMGSGYEVVVGIGARL